MPAQRRMTPGPAPVPEQEPAPAGSVDRIRRAAAHPAILALAAAGVMSILSDTRAVDGLVLVAVALVLVRDTARMPAPPPAAVAPAADAPAAAPRSMAGRQVLTRTPARLAAAGIVALAVVAAGFERYSWPVTLLVWALVSAAVVLTWPQPRSDPPPVPRRGVAVWVVWALLAAVWELIALLGQPTLMTGSPDHPTLSVLFDPVLATYPGRVVVFGVWLAAGWCLCRRVAR